MTGILPIRYMSCHGIGVRHRRGAQPPRHPQLPALVRTVGRRDRARAGAGSAFRLEAPAGVAGRRVRRVADRGPAARLPAEARAPDGAGRLAVALPALLVEAPGCAGAAPGPDGRAVTEPFEEFTRREADTEEAKGEVMTTSETYAPGAAFGAHVEKDGDKWTLVLVRELRHTPAKVWEALTNPEHLREWAPFDADKTLGVVGTVQLTTVGTPSPHVTETKVDRADPPKLLEYSWGGQELRWQLEPLGGGTRLP